MIKLKNAYFLIRKWTSVCRMESLLICKELCSYACSLLAPQQICCLFCYACIFRVCLPQILEFSALFLWLQLHQISVNKHMPFFLGGGGEGGTWSTFVYVVEAIWVVMLVSAFRTCFQTASIIYLRFSHLVVRARLNKRPFFASTLFWLNRFACLSHRQFSRLFQMLALLFYQWYYLRIYRRITDSNSLTRSYRSKWRFVCLRVEDAFMKANPKPMRLKIFFLHDKSRKALSFTIH